MASSWAMAHTAVAMDNVIVPLVFVSATHALLELGVQTKYLAEQIVGNHRRCVQRCAVDMDTAIWSLETAHAKRAMKDLTVVPIHVQSHALNVVSVMQLLVCANVTNCSMAKTVRRNSAQLNV